jgi:hypothetical protein
MYVSHVYVATLNSALRVPSAFARAAAPALLGWMWSPQTGYRDGLCLLLGLSVAGVADMVLAQQRSLVVH